MRKILLFLVSALCISSYAFSQSPACDCYIANADSIFPLLPMSLGTDTGGAPHYRCNDCSSLPIKLPFSFCFYGKNYDTVYISNKGCLTFNKPDFTFSSKGFPAGDTLMLAAFWADIDNRVTNSYSTINYDLTATHLIVQWGTQGYSTFDDDLYNNFQITITNGNDSILSPGNNVSYCYWLMKWASGDSSGGSGGFEAPGTISVPATVGVNKGDGIHYAQIGVFDFPLYSYYGPFNDTSGPYWLENKSFTFNTCVSGNSIPPVILNPNVCNILYLCPGDTESFSTSFLCPQQGQTATLSESAPGFLGITTTASNTTSIYTLTTQLLPDIKDTGIHIITVIATDNSSPALKDSVTYTVVVYKNCADTTLGITSPIKTDNPISLFPNPNNGKFTIQIGNGGLNLENGKAHIEIYNTLGQQVYSQFPSLNSQIPVNLSARPSGVYLYRVLDETGNLLGCNKFIIQ